MAVTITVDGAPGHLGDVAIGVAKALSEQGAYAGATGATWTLYTPPRSLATLTALPGFDKQLVPDVPGTYRVKLVVTYAAAPVATDWVLLRVELPTNLSAVPSALPAPGETNELDTTNGWAKQLNQTVLDATWRGLGAQWEVVYNNLGVPLVSGDVVRVGFLDRWPDRTGGGTGASVPGAALDFVPTLVGGAGAGRKNMALVVEGIAAGARGRVLRRGLVPWNNVTFGWGPVTALYWDGTGSTLTSVPTLYPVGFAYVAAEADANPPGCVWFDPTHVEEIALLPGGSGSATLLDNQAAPVNVAAAGVLEWASADFCGVEIEVNVRIGTPAVQCASGVLYLSFGTVNTVDPVWTVGNDPQVLWSLSAALGIVKLQYRTGNLGSNRTLQYVVRREWRNI